MHQMHQFLIHFFHQLFVPAALLEVKKAKTRGQSILATSISLPAQNSYSYTALFPMGPMGKFEKTEETNITEQIDKTSI